MTLFSSSPPRSCIDWPQARRPPRLPCPPAPRAARLVHRDPGQGQLAVPRLGSLTQVDTRGIDASTQLVRETRDARGQGHPARSAGAAGQDAVLPGQAARWKGAQPRGEAALPDHPGQAQGSGHRDLRRRSRAAAEGQRTGRVLPHRPALDAGRRRRHRRRAGATHQAGREDLGRQARHRPAAGQRVQRTPLRRSGRTVPLSPEQRKQAGRDLHRAPPGENQSLLDDAPAPVHVTGHSMVQPYFGFPQNCPTRSTARYP